MTAHLKKPESDPIATPEISALQAALAARGLPLPIGEDGQVPTADNGAVVWADVGNGGLAGHDVPPFASPADDGTGLVFDGDEWTKAVLVTAATLAAGLSLKQDADDDLDSLAAIANTDDFIAQRKSGAWAGRTPAQVLVDLIAAGAADLASTQVFTGVKSFNSYLGFSNGSALAPSLRLLNNILTGFFRAANDQLGVTAGGSEAARFTPTTVQIAASRTLLAPKFLGSNFRLAADYVRSAEGLYFYSLVDAIDATQTDLTIQDDTFFAGLLAGYYPRSAKIDHGGGDEEFVVLLSAPTDNGDSTYTWPTGQVVRGRPIGGAVGKAHGAGATFVFTDEREHMDGYVMSPNAPASMAFLQGATLDPADPIRVFLPPRGTTSGWPAPETGLLMAMALKSAYGKTVQLIEPVSLRVLHEFTAATYETTVQHYNGIALDYFPYPGLAP